MTTAGRTGTLVLAVAILWTAPATAADTVPVTVDNFIRAESDMYLAGVAQKQGGFGKLFVRREVSPIEDQDVIRQNRDTLYAAQVFDLDAGPVTITLPDAGDRFVSMQVIDEDEYVPAVVYDLKPHTFTKEEIGTRYMIVAFRILVNPTDPKDVEQAHALQDKIKIEQPGGPGKFEIPNWSHESQNNIRAALLQLGNYVTDTRRAFGAKGEVDPVQRLISAATTWGGNPPKDAIYLNYTPAKNDGNTIYKLHIGKVPVDGFWSISLYNASGYFEKNALDSYSLNNITAAKNADGSVDVQFGGCDGKIPNCLVTMPGWSYTARLYRPRAEILDGSWKFPEAEPAN
jgi:hypothetical protein